MPRVLPCLTLAVMSVACAGLTPSQGAHTLGQGRLQVGLEPGVTALVGPRERAWAAPTFDATVRYGVFEHLDVGARLGQSGLAVSAKVMLTPRRWPVLVSLAPSIAGQLNIGSALDVRGLWLHLALPVLVGVRLGAHQLVIGPRVDLFASPGVGRWAAAGGSLGVLLRVSPAVALLPEVALLAPLSSPAPFETDDAFARLTGGLLGQARLTFLIGPADDPR